MTKNTTQRGKTMEKEVKTPINNTRKFRKIVRDFNEQYGYDFQLPKDTNYADKYAHPVHKDERLELSGQIDEDTERIYGISVKIDGTQLPHQYYSDFPLRDELLKVVTSDAFQERLKWVNILKDKRRELDDMIKELSSTIADDATADIQREEAYDLLISTAKALYKSN